MADRLWAAVGDGQLVPNQYPLILLTTCLLDVSRDKVWGSIQKPEFMVGSSTTHLAQSLIKSFCFSASGTLLK